MSGERTCLNCGCTDSEGCIEGCWWVLQHETAPLGVCSMCQGDVALEDLEQAAERWHARQSRRRKKRSNRRKAA